MPHGLSWVRYLYPEGFQAPRDSAALAEALDALRASGESTVLLERELESCLKTRQSIRAKMVSIATG